MSDTASARTAGTAPAQAPGSFYAAGPALSLGAAVQTKLAESTQAIQPPEEEQKQPAIQMLQRQPAEQPPREPAEPTQAEQNSEDEPVQTQLKVGPPNDSYEREADHVADTVMRAPQPAEAIKRPSAAPLTDQITPVEETRAQPKCAECAAAEQAADGEKDVQPKCAECAAAEHVQAKAEFPPLPDATKAPSAVDGPEGEKLAADTREAQLGEEKKDKGEEQKEKVGLPDIEPYNPPEITPPLQMKAPAGATAGHGSPSTGLHSTLLSSKGGGNPLAPAVRSNMEQHFGSDLSRVRIHTSGDAIAMNRGLGARAFAHRNDIYFNAGEYAPGSAEGKRLLAHELTHTVQQGAIGERIQRFTAPEQDVTLDPKPERPSDGEEVSGRMNEKISNDDNVQDQDSLSEEERKEKEKPDRGEVRQESSTIASSGEAKPSVDRGAAAEEKTTAQKEQLAAELDQQAAEAGEQQAEGENEKADPSPAETAAQGAQAAQQRAQAIVIPTEPAPFQHPRIEAPVDSEGKDLPRNSQIDTQVRGLGYIGEMLRQKGYEMKRSAAQQQIGAYGQDAVLEREREDLANAEEGTATMETHNEARREIATQSHDAHAESMQRQQFVASKAPDLAGKADEGKGDSGALASEASSRAGESQSNIPDDEDARADGEKQSGDMQEVAQGAASMDQAITQTGERARQYTQDAAAAAEQNEQSNAQISETEETIGKLDARIEEMNGKNAASQAQIDKVAGGPALIRSFARHTAQSGDELIAATIVMEQELSDIQEQYLAGMAGIESREAAEKRIQEEQAKKEPPPEMSPEEQQLAELAGLSEPEQEQRIAQMAQPQRDGLLATLEKMIKETPDQGTDATEGARLKVDTGLSKKIMGEPPADPRAPEIQKVENRRTERVSSVLDVADKNMNFLTEEQQRMLANKLVAESITDDIKNINILQMGKGMLQGMIDPRQSLTGVVGGFEKMLTGFANIGNWDAWKKDPLGNLLQIAADISTGLATIFSSILGIAALITALMVALTIISWGTLSWLTGPVIGWMGTVMTYAGWGAIITGSLAVYFNYLAYIKNLHDAGTAETARELFGNTEQMKQNASDGFQGAMAVVEGVGAVKMGPKLSSGEFFKEVPRSPGQWARQTIQGVRDRAASVARAPAAIGRGIKRLFQGGRQGLVRFKEWLQGLFRRRKPGHLEGTEPHVRTPSGSAQHQSHLDDARSKPLSEMNSAERAAEMSELGENRPRPIDPSSEYHKRYDVEIESNGHTYRRNRDGGGWCRFSAKECGIPENALPDNVKAQVEHLDTGSAAAKERLTGREQAKAKGWREDPPEGYEWYSGSDGEPMVRNKAGNDGPVREYDPVTQTFPEKPTAAPKPDVRPVEGQKSTVPHSDLDVDTQKQLKQLEAERTAAQGRKQTAKSAGDEAAASKAHGEMVRASEQLGEVATDAAVKKTMPNAQRLDAELPGAQKSGEFDRIYKNGEDVYIYEGKGAGSQRGSRKTAEGLRAEQGTPQYRDDIIRNMEQKVEAHTLSDAYRTDPAFKARVDSLQRSVDELKLARQQGKLHYVQVNQKVDALGNLRPEVELTPFDPKKVVSTK